MAAEAVYKIKAAEEQARDIVKKANAEAKQILSNAREKSALCRKAVLDEAMNEREKILRSAAERAEERCVDIIQKGNAQRAALLAPDEAKMDRAIKLVMERIVSV